MKDIPPLRRVQLCRLGAWLPPYLVLTANNISQRPVVTSATAIGAQPYWSVDSRSGKIRLPKHMMVTRTDANTPNADRIPGIHVDLKNRYNKSRETILKNIAQMLYAATPAWRVSP